MTIIGKSSAENSSSHQPGKVADKANQTDISPATVVSPALPATQTEKARAELMAIIRQPYQSNCAACNGRGLLGGNRCPDCKGSGLVSMRLI